MFKSIFLTPFLCSIFQCAYAQIETRTSSYPNGQVQFAYTYAKGVLNGPYFAYYADGKKWADGSYVDGQLEGVFVIYTPGGDTLSKEIYTKGKQSSMVVFYQMYPDSTCKLISKQGFVTVSNGESVTLDETTPDGYLETVYELVGTDMFEKIYIWEKGKRKEFPLTKPDGTQEIIFTGDKPGMYEWKKGERVFIRPLNNEEKKMRGE